MGGNKLYPVGSAGCADPGELGLNPTIFCIVPSCEAGTQ